MKSSQEYPQCNSAHRMFQPADQQDGVRKTPVVSGRRRALGELTNTPLLLSPSAVMSGPENISTPPKTVPASPDTVTPTHNLKLLTELASKISGTAGGSSARQTLQFEDVDPNRYTSEPIFLPSSQTEAPSPHRDHPYGVKQVRPAPEPAKFREEFVLVQPVQARTNKVKTKTGGDIFAPPAEKGVNRKEKSLGLLAERMLDGLPKTVQSGSNLELQLDDTARLLQTERRRIYDIVNVFEAVQIMSKVGKNVYQWHGRTFLLQSLAWLRQLAIKLGMDEQYRVAREQEIQMMIHNQENVNIENVSPVTPGTPLTPTFSPLASPSPLSSPLMSPYNSPNDPNGTSMGINTQKFLMLFLVTPAPQTLTLDFAAKVIHGSQQVEKTRLTRIRRLYDIANILQSLELIRKVQVTDGRGKKPAFQFIGPDVSSLTLTEEEKKAMPATRQKNSLLAVGRNLVLLPEKDTGAKRGRSLSEERKGDDQQQQQQPAKLLRTRSESRASDGPASSLFDLSEVCEAERRKLSTESLEGDRPADQEPRMMKPPTPGRPPSRKKHLLQRYYSDSALLSSSVPEPGPSRTSVSVTKVGESCEFTSPRPLVATRQYSPAQISAVPPQSPRPSYSPLHPSPLTKAPAPSLHTPIRSPITPRDLRNASILPPHSPSRSKLITCSPMGSVGRSLLSSPASPRAPIDLTMRSSRLGLGRSPLASRSLNLPPTPPTPPTPSSTNQSPPASQTSQTSLLKSNLNENSSPLLRAYLANNKNRIFKPILAGQTVVEEGVSVLPLELMESSVTLSPSTTTCSPVSSARSSPPPTTSPDGSTNSSSASELEGIFGKSLSRPVVSLASLAPHTTGETPLDFSGLISTPPRSGLTPTSSPFNILSLSSPFLKQPRDLTTPHFQLASSPTAPPLVKKNQRN